MEDAAGLELEVAAQQSLSPAERTAAVQALPLGSRTAGTRCLEALGGLDTEASRISLRQPATLPLNHARRMRACDAVMVSCCLVLQDILYLYICCAPDLLCT